ncbi:MAG: electron transfer flavoprotein subunit beta/FixA family protein [Candidatus Marinimicrobia bacterium]|nr:electron transfer flavoprotein subunit beta/FixA family protein [Candidatus Neomarinimicrobiota bacterium]
MKIIVCVKHVPATDARIKLGADGKSIDETGINFIINPYDEFAIEEALLIKEKLGGEIMIVTLGESSAIESIRKGLAMGADKAVHLVCENVALADPWAVANRLAEEIREHDSDLILCGKNSADAQNQQVGSLVAAMLEKPVVTSVVEIEAEENTVTVWREIESGKEVYELSLPALLTVNKTEHEPRYASLRGIMMAKKKPVETKDVSIENGAIVVEEMSLPKAKEPCKIVGTDADSSGDLANLLHNEAKVI